MRLKPEQLNQHLQSPLKPVYVVSGDEPLLSQEICDSIRAAAKAQGFDEREVHHVDGQYKWAELIDSANSMSLFASRKVIELRIENGKPGDQGSKALLEICQQPNPDNILLVVLPKVDKSAQNSKWFKALDKLGAFIQHWPVERNQLPGWIANRLRANNLKADREALALLADRTDGNLLAAAQEIEKLKLITHDTITAADVEASVGDASRYDVFALTEACFKGDVARSLHILSVLQGEGLNALQPLGIIANDIRLLLTFCQLKHSGVAEDKALQQLKVFWPKKQQQMKGASRRLNVTVIQQSLQLCNQVDFATKSLLQDDAWRLLSVLVTKLCGVKALPNSA